VKHPPLVLQRGRACRHRFSRWPQSFGCAASTLVLPGSEEGRSGTTSSLLRKAKSRVASVLPLGCRSPIPAGRGCKSGTQAKSTAGRGLGPGTQRPPPADMGWFFSQKRLTPARTTLVLSTCRKSLAAAPRALKPFVRGPIVDLEQATAAISNVRKA
jgi:hypothetical protein